MTATATSWPSGPVMVWHLAGQPRRASLVLRDVPGVCAMCGTHDTQTMATKDVLGGNFTDQYLLARPDSARVCYACTWVCSGKPPDTVRMWTVLARPDTTLPPSHPKAPVSSQHVHLTARNDMRAVVQTLADPPDGPWLISVAESGQKHHVPYSRINHSGGRWTVRMDALDVSATPAEFRDVYRHVLHLRAARFSAAEIETVTPRMLTADTLPVWRTHGEPLTRWSGSALLHLAAFLPNKEHLDEYLHTYG